MTAEVAFPDVCVPLVGKNLVCEMRDGQQMSRMWCYT